MQYYIIKSEPSEWSFKDQKEQIETFWDGVYNYQARNNLKSMQQGDFCLFYHSIKQKAIVGVVKVVKEYEPYKENENFGGVTVRYHSEFKTPVSLQEIKQDKDLENIGLVRQARLSVIKITKSEFDKIYQKGNN